MVASIIAWGASVLTAAGVSAATATFIATFAVNFAVSALITRIFGQDQQGPQDNGTRQQIPPNNTNAIPIVYGDAYLGGTFVDAVLTTNQQTMYYVLAVSCVSPNGQFTFDTTKFYYGDRLVTFDGTDQTKVVSLTDEAGNVDTKINGNLFINLYRSTVGGTITPLNGASAPNVVMGGSDIDVSLRWPSSGRQMNGLAFAIVKLNYSTDAGTTNLLPITFYAKHYLNGIGAARPGDVWYDYITNAQYGGAVSTSFVDSNSSAALNVYSDQLITYTPSGGGSATQARYRMNGVLDAGQTVLSNLDKIMTCCDSWMAYNAAIGKWSVVINKAETSTYSFDDDNIIGEIRVSATDITQSVNQVEAKFPDKGARDQPNFVNIKTPVGLLYPNEPINKYSVTYDLCNDSVQAQYLANRILEQAREDLIVSFTTTYYGIQVDAGDVVSVTNSDYGWTNKLFRVVKVNEASLPDGSLGAKLEMTEYSASVYDDPTITQYAPVPNSNLPSVAFFTPLSAPTITSINFSSAIPNFSLTVTMPAKGRVTAIDLYYASTPTPLASDFKLLQTASLTNGAIYAPSTSFVFANLVLPTGALVATTYYFAFVVRNQLAASTLSPLSAGLPWNPVTNPFNFIAGNMTAGSAANANIAMGQSGAVISTFKSPLNIRKTGADPTLINFAAQNNVDGNVTIWGASANNAVGNGNGVTGSHTTANTFDSWQRLGALGSGVANAGVWGLSYADNASSLGGVFQRYSGTNSSSPGTLARSIQLATASYSAFSPSGQGKIYIVDGNGPFTGFHEGMIAIDSPLDVGDIVTDVSVFYRANVSNVLFNVASSNTANQSRVLGVVSAILPVQTNTPGILWEPVEIYTEDSLGPEIIMQLIPGYDLEELKTTYKVVQVNAVGEGQINVCGENGDIQAGDLIVASSMAGKGMKQSDNIVRSITVAKARESVSFSGATDVQMIACIYLGG